MGAQLWSYVSGSHESPQDALQEIQSKYLAEYDLHHLLQTRLESVRKAVEHTEIDDEYGLLDFYRDELEILESLAADGIPEATLDQLNFFRKIHSASGEYSGTVLDVENVSFRLGEHVTGQMTNSQLLEWVGHEKPTQKEAEEAIDLLNEQLGRAESVCFKIYSDDRSKDIGWMFVGNSVD